MRRQPKVKQPVPLATAKARALQHLYKYPDRLTAASSVAHSIWPGVAFRAQGAGGAASRILKLLADDGLAGWTTDHHGDYVNWGWQITKKGRKEHARNVTHERIARDTARINKP